MTISFPHQLGKKKKKEHCGRPDCMFGCQCRPTTRSVAGTGTPEQNETFAKLPQRVPGIMDNDKVRDPQIFHKNR